MPAYTTVCNTSFNGFTSPNHTIYLEPPSLDEMTSPFKPVKLGVPSNGQLERLSKI